MIKYLWCTFSIKSVNIHLTVVYPYTASFLNCLTSNNSIMISQDFYSTVGKLSKYLKRQNFIYGRIINILIIFIHQYEVVDPFGRTVVIVVGIWFGTRWKYTQSNTWTFVPLKQISF